MWLALQPHSLKANFSRAFRLRARLCCPVPCRAVPCCLSILIPSILPTDWPSCVQEAFYTILIVCLAIDSFQRQVVVVYSFWPKTNKSPLHIGTRADQHTYNAITPCLASPCLALLLGPTILVIYSITKSAKGFSFSIRRRSCRYLWPEPAITAGPLITQRESLLLPQLRTTGNPLLLLHCRR